MISISLDVYPCPTCLHYKEQRIGMDILNAIAAVLSRMGLEYVAFEIGGVILLFLVWLNVRKILKNQEKRKTDINNIFRKIQEHHDSTIEILNKHHREIDPPHLYSKFNKMEDNLDQHETEEVRLLHDISKGVAKIDATLTATKSCYNHKSKEYDD
jgi:hypothetical protein